MTVGRIVRGIRTRDDVAAEGSRAKALIASPRILDMWERRERKTKGIRWILNLRSCSDPKSLPRPSRGMALVIC
jgi:hypothetical protein